MDVIKKSVFAVAFSLLLLSFVGCSTLKPIPLQQSDTNGDMKLSYQENYRGEKHWYIFNASVYCPTSSPLRVKMFESVKKYSSTHTRKPTSVRVINIYADINREENCSKMNKEIAVEKIEIPIDNKRMTHVYVTYAADIRVESGH